MHINSFDMQAWKYFTPFPQSSPSLTTEKKKGGQDWEMEREK